MTLKDIGDLIDDLNTAYRNNDVDAIDRINTRMNNAIWQFRSGGAAANRATANQGA